MYFLLFNDLSRFYLYRVKAFWLYCSQNFKLFGFAIFQLWAYLMKVILETKFDIDVFIIPRRAEIAVTCTNF